MTPFSRKPFRIKILHLLFFLVMLSLFACSESRIYDEKMAVHLVQKDEGYEIIRNGKPFAIRGVCGQTNLGLLQSIGGNTIRTYDTTNLGAVLDSAHAHNLAVIAGIYLPVSTTHWLYGNDSIADYYNTAIKKVIEQHKDHPALLMWCLGNELIYYDFWDLSFAKTYNMFVETIYETDGQHPVTTAIANFSDRAIVNFRLKIPEIDLFLFNTFGRLPKLEEDMEPYKLIWDGPFLVGEYGENGPWESETTEWGAPLEMNSNEKAHRLAHDFNENLPKDNPRYLGGLAFYWGQRQEVTHTWFNFFSTDTMKSAPVFSLAKLWGKPLAGNKPPEVKSFTINGTRQFNNFLFGPGTRQRASFHLTDPDNDSLYYSWELLPEDWYFQKAKKPQAVVGLLHDSYAGHIEFETPQKPGPYRLYAKAFDKHGNFAVANLPFYVVR